MKNYIEHCLKYYPTSFKRPAEVVEHMFATLGNGIDLDNKGYLRGNYRGEQAFPFRSPVQLNHIYPWSEDERSQPFRKLAGCRDVGFKEAAQYFIDCVKTTPDSVKNIGDWKKNLHIVEQVLLGTPTIQDQYTINDMDKFIASLKGQKLSHQAPVDGTKIPCSSSVKKVWFFDVQWTDCPEEVEEEVRHIWRAYELGNDNYIWKTQLTEELFNEYPKVYFWLKYNGVPEGEKVIVHWWW